MHISTTIIARLTISIIGVNIVIMLDLNFQGKYLLNCDFDVVSTLIYHCVYMHMCPCFLHFMRSRKIGKLKTMCKDFNMYTRIAELASLTVKRDLYFQIVKTSAFSFELFKLNKHNSNLYSARKISIPW